MQDTHPSSWKVEGPGFDAFYKPALHCNVTLIGEVQLQRATGLKPKEYWHLLMSDPNIAGLLAPSSARCILDYSGRICSPALEAFPPLSRACTESGRVSGEAQIGPILLCSPLCCCSLNT